PAYRIWGCCFRSSFLGPWYARLLCCQRFWHTSTRAMKLPNGSDRQRCPGLVDTYSSGFKESTMGNQDHPGKTSRAFRIGESDYYPPRACEKTMATDYRVIYCCCAGPCMEKTSYMLS